MHQLLTVSLFDTLQKKGNIELDTIKVIKQGIVIS